MAKSACLAGGLLKITAIFYNEAFRDFGTLVPHFAVTISTTLNNYKGNYRGTFLLFQHALSCYVMFDWIEKICVCRYICIGRSVEKSAAPPPSTLKFFLRTHYIY